NWEWMIECALQQKAELVIVSRDADYGIEFEKKGYINDHLRQEFSERVSQKRQVLLFTKLSEALKEFKVTVTAQETEVENQIIEEQKIKMEAKSGKTLQVMFDEIDEMLKGLKIEEIK